MGNLNTFEETRKRLWNELRSMETALTQERSLVSSLKEKLQGVTNRLEDTGAREREAYAALLREKVSVKELQEELQRERNNSGALRAAIARCVAERASFLANENSMKAAVALLEAKLQQALREADMLRTRLGDEALETVQLRHHESVLRSQVEEMARAVLHGKIRDATAP